MQVADTNHPVRTAFGLGFLALLVIVAFHYQDLLDAYALATFHPSAQMQGIESRLDLTEKAKAAFYRAKPQVDDKATFNHDCDSQPNELELGCYYQGRIYVLQIDNPSLAPEMDVVTAHELMHAVWAHLSSHDQQILGNELETVYTKSGDADLKQRMADYAQSEPGEETNELHSILGTEDATLTPDLETHYSAYFSDRPVIVAAHEAYQNVFNSQRAELASELATIRAEKGQLGVLNAQLETDKARGDISLYNSLVPRQNQLVDDINSRIAVYQQGVDEYNALSKSLDSQEITDTETTAQ